MSPFVIIANERLFKVYEKSLYSGKNRNYIWVLKGILGWDEGRSYFTEFLKLLCVDF